MMTLNRYNIESLQRQRLHPLCHPEWSEGPRQSELGILKQN
jgi:hypothetical protein